MARMKEVKIVIRKTERKSLESIIQEDTGIFLGGIKALNERREK